MHWSTKYIGRQYDGHSYDCLDLAVEIARDELNLTIIPPPHSRRPDASADKSAMMMAMRLDYAEKITTPVEGHPIILMHRNRPAHIGVAVYVDDEWQCLHNTSGLGVIRQSLSRIEQSFKTGIEGFYRWKLYQKLNIE